MKFILIRHGVTELNQKGIINCQLVDEPILSEGVEQARAAAKFLPRSIVHVYCSDMLRTRQTADVLNVELGKPVTYHKELRERRFGDLEGESWPQVTAKYGPGIQQADIAQEYNYRAFGGESFDDVAARVQQVIELAKRDYDEDETVLFVTHAGVIKMLYKKYLNEIRPDIGNCEISKFDL